MSRNRSSAYWATNRYGDEAAEPAPTAPLHDLPAAAAARFKLLRAGLSELAGVAEAVRYMGASWRWAWEYGVGNRKLCWVHVIGDALSATFTMSDSEEDRLRRDATARIDATERIEGFLPQLDDLVSGGLVILDDVKVVKYVGRGHENAPSGVE